MSLLPETSPSEYLLQRFDAIVEFEETVSRLERLTQKTPYDVRYAWRSGVRAGIYEYPSLHSACVRLESVLGMDDSYWKDGR